MMKKAAVILNAAIVCLVVYAWERMFFGMDEGALLSSARLQSLKFFTVDSNILAAAASLCILPFEVREAFGRPGRSGRPVRGGIPVWALVLKLAATTAVSLTFVTVMVFLGPMYGYPAMFYGATLYMHLIVPLLAIFTLCVTERNKVLTLRHTLTAVVPMLLYGTAYLVNILIHGVENNDWYNFAQWGIPASFLVFLIVASVTWLLALLLRIGSRKK